MSSNRNQQDAGQREQQNQTLLLHIAFNVIATAAVFLLTINDDEPFIGPISQMSMVIRWATIAIATGFIQFCWIRGWLNQASDDEDITECPDCYGTGFFQPISCDHRRLDQ